jgi:hypothetical protein
LAALHNKEFWNDSPLKKYVVLQVNDAAVGGRQFISFVSGTALAYTHITEEAGRGWERREGYATPLTCGHLVRDLGKCPHRTFQLVGRT